MHFLFLLFPLLLVSLGMQFSNRRELDRVRASVASLRHDRALDRSALETVRELIIEINDSSAALSESLGKLQEHFDGLLPAVTGQTDELAMRINSMSKSLDTKAVYVHTALAEFTKPYAEIRENLDRLTKALENLTANDGPANPDAGLDAQLSKAMEEGVLNLMQYAAGKTSGGIEVGLG